MAVPYSYILGIAIVLIIVGAVLLFIPEVNPPVGDWSLGSVLVVLGVIVLVIWVIYVLWSSRPAPH